MNLLRADVLVEANGVREIRKVVAGPAATARSAAFRLALALALVASSSALGCHASSEAERTRRPNVIVILADDLGWRDTGAYGSRFFETPHIDALASDGVRFTNAYSASPLCSPTRAGLLTGLSPARLRFTSPQGHRKDVVLDPIVPKQAPPNLRAVPADTRTRVPREHYTIAEAMRDAGYATAHFGKWHLGFEPYAPEQHGFDHVSPGGNRPFPTRYFSPYHLPGFPDGTPSEHLDERLAREAVAYMRAHRDEPFLINFWLFSVHTPIQTRPEFIRKYRKNLIPDDPQQSPAMAGMIESMDSSIGTLLAGVDELGLRENTIVVFLSDNGGVSWNLSPRAGTPPPTSNLPLRGGKGQLYEGGVRVPLIVRWPGVVEAGVVRDELVTSTDLYPTILEMTGIAPRPEQIFDGISIVPALEGRPLPRDTVFTHFPHYMPPGLSPPGTSVRKEDWKLIRFYAEGEHQADRLELYDLADDPGEKRNIAKDHPGRVVQLNGLISQYLESMSALVPIANPAYSPAGRPHRATRNDRR